MLTKSNNAWEEKVAIPDLAQKAKGWCNSTRALCCALPKRKRAWEQARGWKGTWGT